VSPVAVGLTDRWWILQSKSLAGIDGTGSAGYPDKGSGRSAAWLARLLGVQEVAGSNPAVPTRYECCRKVILVAYPPCSAVRRMCSGAGSRTTVVPWLLRPSWRVQRCRASPPFRHIVLHRGLGQAVVHVNGRNIYRSIHDTSERKANFTRSSEGCLPTEPGSKMERGALLHIDIIVASWWPITAPMLKATTQKRA
jgi:hypothetical protein